MNLDSAYGMVLLLKGSVYPKDLKILSISATTIGLWSFMNKKIFICSLLLMIFFLLTCGYAYEDYTYEFNNEDEMLKTRQIWTYLNKDNQKVTIDFFEYCNDNECTFVIFDVTNKKPVPKEEALSLLSDYKLEEYASVGIITEEQYSLELGDSSTCKFFAPKFWEESKNLATEETVKLMVEIAPENAAKVIKSLYGVGKALGYVKKADTSTLIISGICVSGEFFNDYTLSLLNSCSSYVLNIKRKKTYYGQWKDLLLCHENAIKNLELLRHNPPIWIQSAEIEFKNILCGSSLSSFFCDNYTKKESNYNLIISKINDLETLDTHGILNELDDYSKKTEEISNKRIEDKFNKANSAFKQNYDRFISINKKITDIENDVVYQINGTFNKNKPLFSLIKIHLNPIEEELNNSKKLVDDYKCNSAISTSKTISEQLDMVESELEKELIKKPEWNWSLVTLFVLIIVVLIYLWKSKRFPKRF